MIAGRTRESLLDLTKSSIKLVLISTYESRMLLTIQHEVELRDRADLESHGCITGLICLHSAEHDAAVLISSSLGLKDRLESHAWWAPW